MLHPIVAVFGNHFDLVFELGEDVFTGFNILLVLLDEFFAIVHFEDGWQRFFDLVNALFEHPGDELD